MYKTGVMLSGNQGICVSNPIFLSDQDHKDGRQDMGDLITSMAKYMYMLYGILEFFFINLIYKKIDRLKVY